MADRIARAKAERRSRTECVAGYRGADRGLRLVELLRPQGRLPSHSLRETYQLLGTALDEGSTAHLDDTVQRKLGSPLFDVLRDRMSQRELDEVAAMGRKAPCRSDRLSPPRSCPLAASPRRDPQGDADLLQENRLLREQNRALAEKLQAAEAREHELEELMKDAHRVRQLGEGLLAEARKQRDGTAELKRIQDEVEQIVGGVSPTASLSTDQPQMVRRVSFKEDACGEVFRRYDADCDQRWSRAEAWCFAKDVVGWPLTEKDWEGTLASLPPPHCPQGWSRAYVLDQLQRAHFDAAGFLERVGASGRRDVSGLQQAFDAHSAGSEHTKASEVLAAAGIAAEDVSAADLRRGSSALRRHSGLTASQQASAASLTASRQPSALRAGTAGSSRSLSSSLRRPPSRKGSLSSETDVMRAVAAGDLRRLSSKSLKRAKVHKLFALFDKDEDGLWNFAEARRFRMATSRVALDRKDWESMCEELGADPSTGLNEELVMQAYADQEGLDDDLENAVGELRLNEQRATRLLATTTDRGLLAVYYERLETWREEQETKRRAGYRNMDPGEEVTATLESDTLMATERWVDVPVDELRRARIERLFALFDKDGDGFWSFQEARRFALATGGLMPERSEWEATCSDLGADLSVGLDLAMVMAAYGGSDAIDDDYEAVILRLQESEHKASQLLATTTEWGLTAVYFRKWEYFKELKDDERRGGYAEVDPLEAAEWEDGDTEEEEDD